MELAEVEKYYIKYGPMVLRRCRQILLNEEKALDAMQEVFTKVLSKRDKLSANHPSSLFYTIATNLCLNIIKKEKGENMTEAEISLETYITTSDDFVEKTFLNDLIERVFSAEPPSTRTMAYLHYIDRLTLEQTARECGLSVSGVRKRLRKLSEKVQLWQSKEGQLL